MEYQFKSVLEKFQNNKVWSYHFKIPETVISKFDKQDKRFICTINNIVTYPCGLLSAGELGDFINVNATIRKKAGLSLNDTVSLILTKDTSKYGFPIPATFQELLNQDPKFEALFHQLTPGKQRTLLHKISTYKKEETQLQKLMILRHYLIQVKGKLDFKELYESFKKRN